MEFLLSKSNPKIEREQPVENEELFDHLFIAERSALKTSNLIQQFSKFVSGLISGKSN